MMILQAGRIIGRPKSLSLLPTKRIGRLLSSSGAVGDVPLPLRLLYINRSPSVVLHGGTKAGDPRWPLFLLLSANTAVLYAWNWIPPEQDRELLRRVDETYDGIIHWEPEQTAFYDDHIDMMTRNFTVSIENLVAGRLHTLVTAGFSHFDIKHYLGNMFALVLFGYRSCAALGGPAFLGLYMAGAFACSSAHVMHNLYSGCTAHDLTCAERRGVHRNTLRYVSSELAKCDDETWTPRSWILFWRQHEEHHLNASHLVDSGSSTTLESDSPWKDVSNICERVGRLMAETGARAVDLVRARKEVLNEHEVRHENKAISETSGQDEARKVKMARRLAELERENQLNEDDTEWRQHVEAESQQRKARPKSLWKRLQEQRRLQQEESEHEVKRRQMSEMKISKEIVDLRYNKQRDQPSLGASGAVMAITNGSVLLFPRDRVVSGGISLSLPASAGLYTISDLAGIVYPNPVDTVDHAGHLGGAGMGLLYVWSRWIRLSRVAHPEIMGPLPILAHWERFLASKLDPLLFR